MDKNLIKPFTITSAAMAAVFVGQKVFTFLDKKQHNKNVDSELARLHEQQLAEIKKNGKCSEETLELIRGFQRRI